MSITIVGVGRQPSIRSINAIALTKIATSHGQPLKIEAKADGVEFVAERSEPDKDFDHFTLRVSKDYSRAADARTAADASNGACEVSEDDRFDIYICPAAGADVQAGVKAVDAICAKLTLPEIWRFEGSGFGDSPLSMELLFRAIVQYKASDLHLSPGRKPIFRVENQVRSADIMGPVSATQILNLIRGLAPEDAWHDFEETQQCTFAFHQVGIGFARTSAFVRSGAPHITFRYLPEKISSFAELGIPTDLLEQLAKLTSGLLLIAGMGGSGKSTTAAAVIEYINQNRSVHILTIEDPVEITFTPKRAVISQRSLGSDVRSFAEGVQGALRQDPDVLYIAEMRDVDTIRSAISAASTGVLVVSTINSANASGVVNRIVSFFEPVERDLVRSQLQDNLRGVLCQKLVPKKAGGRVPAIETLFNDIKPISTAIHEGSTLGIRIGMQQNLSKSQLFEHYLHGLYKKDVITLDVAKEAAPELSMMEQILMGTYSVPRIDR